MNVMTDRADECSHRAAPITLARSAAEISASIVYEGFNFVGIAHAVKGDMKQKIRKPAAHFERSLERRHELAFMGGLEQNVTRIELNHERKLQNRRVVRVVK